MRTIEADVIVVGGGPAGAATATILAKKGRDVIVLEKEQFPRYHIGESLIPYTWFALDRLGMLDRMNNSEFVRKYSVQFVSTQGKLSQPFYFTQHTEHECAKTWQVERSEFDTILLENAKANGAKVLMPAMAKGLIKDTNGAVVGVTARDADGSPMELRAPMTVDASGRDLFTVSREGWRMDDPELKKIAVWSYFKGAKRDPGMDEGATTVAFVPDKGWFWYIPLQNDLVSVGVVAERDYLYRDQRDPDAILEREIAGQPWVLDHVSSGTRVKPSMVTGDYSYRSRHCAADGLVLTGDAFAFLDPVFSSGVFLALTGGVMAADAIDAALDAGDTSASRFEEYGEKLNYGIESMRRLVYAFYDVNFSFAKVFRKYPELHTDLTDCLIGHVMRDFDKLWAAVGEFATVPKAVEYGRPVPPRLTAPAI